MKELKENNKFAALALDNVPTVLPDKWRMIYGLTLAILAIADEVRKLRQSTHKES